MYTHTHIIYHIYLRTNNLTGFVKTKRIMSYKVVSGVPVI